MNLNLTIIGQSISFLIFIGFCWIYIWPHIIKALHERQTRIAEGLAAADRGQHEQQLAEQRAKETLKHAKQEAAEILAQAQKRGNEMVEEAKSAARNEGERIKQSAQAEIQLEVNRARETLRKQVAGIAVAGAERILQREVDAKKHKEVLDQLAAEI
jgi:F-type H+-transporting ATPase subunit b